MQEIVIAILLLSLPGLAIACRRRRRCAQGRGRRLAVRDLLIFFRRIASGLAGDPATAAQRCAVNQLPTYGRIDRQIEAFLQLYRSQGIQRPASRAQRRAGEAELFGALATSRRHAGGIALAIIFVSTFLCLLDPKRSAGPIRASRSPIAPARAYRRACRSLGDGPREPGDRRDPGGGLFIS